MTEDTDTIDENVCERILKDLEFSLADRLRSVVYRVGMDECVRITAKSEKTLRRYFAGDEPPFSVLHKLCQYSGASLDWVSDGERRTAVDRSLERQMLEIERKLKKRYDPGSPQEAEAAFAVEMIDGMLEVIAAEERQATSAPEQPGFEAKSLVPSTLFVVPKFDDVRASAGPGAIVQSETQTGSIAFDVSWLRDIGVHPPSAKILFAEGDSMYPTIPNGSPMLVDTSKIEIRHGCIYVFDLDGDLMVKRIERLPDGTIDLISDNRTLYPTRNLTRNRLNQMRVVGRVFSALQTF